MHATLAASRVMLRCCREGELFQKPEAWQMFSQRRKRKIKKYSPAVSARPSSCNCEMENMEQVVWELWENEEASGRTCNRKDNLATLAS